MGLALAACAPESTPGPPSAGAALPPGAQEAADSIQAEPIRESTLELSDDRFEGRGPGTAGDAAARAWIADRMAALGLEPAGDDGTWEQLFDIVSITAQVPERWAFQSSSEELSFRRDEEFVAFSGVQESEARIDDAELVFVGYGIQAPEYEWDDYKGEDVSGKVLLMLNNDPDWSPELFEGDTRLYYGRWTYKYEIAAARGAAGAIIVHTTASAGYPWQVVHTSWTGPQSELPAAGEPRIQVGGWLTEDAAGRVAALAGHDLDALVESARSPEFAPVALGVRTSLVLGSEVERTQTANVLGRLPGSDPDLSDEVVIFGAHHDHLGRGAPDVEGDDVYNGALDNALGVAEQLAIARAFTRLPEPPPRSILFAFWGAEEQGLIGSRFYAAHPTVAPGRIAANLNMDGGNIWGETRDVVVVGHGKSDLDALVEKHAGAQGREVRPDPFADRGFFYRSDQFSLAKVGVPAIYLDSGIDFVGRPEGWGREQNEAYERERYHQPSDEVTDDWVLDGLVQDARLLFACGLDVANRDRLPAWNPGDEFEAARREALAAVGP
jgi:Zn-dependent M28 family amino/carboxypeptidase